MELGYNRRAKFDYEFIDELTAGIQLTGHETKSVKMGRIQLAGGYVILKEGEAFLIGSKIASFQPNNAPKHYKSARTRKLLLTKKELDYLMGKKQAGYTIIPLRAFIKRNKIKLNIVIGRGRKKHDKRELIKKRDAKREIRRKMNK